jgi:hypothetical protein
MGLARRTRIAEQVVLDEAAAVSDLIEPDYAYGYAVWPRRSCEWSAEDCARQMFEGAPKPIRVGVVLGWRFGLLLRLGPLQAPTHVLGWRIAQRTRTDVLLSVSSPLLDARLVIQVRGGITRHLTLIRFRRKLSRVLWALAAPIHERVIPYLLSGAAERCGPQE